MHLRTLFFFLLTSVSLKLYVYNVSYVFLHAATLTYLLHGNTCNNVDLGSLFWQTLYYLRTLCHLKCHVVREWEQFRWSEKGMSLNTFEQNRTHTVCRIKEAWDQSLSLDSVPCICPYRGQSNCSLRNCSEYASNRLCCICYLVSADFVPMYDYTISVFASSMKNVAACDSVRNLFVTFCRKLLPKTVETVSILNKRKLN